MYIKSFNFIIKQGPKMLQKITQKFTCATFCRVAYLGHVGVEQPSQLVLAGLGREVARDGVADEECRVFAQQRRPVN